MDSSKENTSLKAARFGIHARTDKFDETSMLIEQRSVSPQEKSQYFRLIRHSSEDSDQKVPDDSSQCDSSQSNDYNNENFFVIEKDEPMKDIGNYPERGPALMNESVQIENFDQSDSCFYIEQCNAGQKHEAVQAGYEDVDWLEKTTGDDVIDQSASCSHIEHYKQRNAGQNHEAVQAGYEDVDWQENTTGDDVVEDLNLAAQGVTHNETGLEFYKAGNYRKAKSYWKLAKECGNGQACYHLGLLYEKGLAVKQINKTKATKCFVKAAKKGHPKACYNVAIALLSTAAGKTAAIKLLQKAADQGLKEAQNDLGILHVEVSGKDGYDKAAECFQKAADQKHGDALYNLGVCYENGFGVQADDVPAYDLYKQAAEKGVADAMHNEAVFHEHGRGGQTKSTEMAVEFYKKAAAAGNESSQLDADRLLDVPAIVIAQAESSKLLSTDTNTPESIDETHLVNLIEDTV